MKIAVFHNFPPGGGKRTVYEQVKGLLRKKHQVEVFEIAGDDQVFADLKTLKCPIHSYSFDKNSTLPGVFSRFEADYKNFFVLDRLHHRIATEINKGGFDIVLVHTDKYTESPYILKYLRIPNVYYCHELLRIGYESELAFSEKVSLPKLAYELITRKIRVWIDKTNARSAQTIITSGEYIQDKILMSYGRKSIICRLGVDPNVFLPSGRKGKYILFMGQKDFMTGFDLIQEAISLVSSKIRPPLVVYGFSKGMPDVNNDKILSRIYSQALITVCATHSEPFGLKAIESMSCGTPVLAVNEGGYRQSIVDGKTGWLLPRDPKTFAKKIEYIVTHPTLSSTMGNISRKYIIKYWTWNRHVNQLEKILIKESKSHPQSR